MEDKLSRLKNAMNKHVFSEVKFTETQKNGVHEMLAKEVDDDQTVMLAILQVLQKEKTGYELMGVLCSRGIKRFTRNEGDLYTTLHELEQKGWLESYWEEEQSKVYRLTNRGRKFLKKQELKRVNQIYTTKAIFER
ncbi:PadR family transcriptional regulator [Peribacillus sp. Hz7]|uniref:PadR family transcriptional regulator n=1 Tax=Peribacillus sp. Hz7 TaxID=3344873 RepID=UPI0035CB1429